MGRAHLFADGGGRELAYVAMSRARESTHAWVVADDLAQAAEDLRRDWSARRTPTWALDTGLPATTLREAVASLATPGQARVVALALARSRATANAIGTAAGLSTSAAELAKARAALHQAEQTRADLSTGRGAYLGTEAGQAVADLARAEAGLAAARQARLRTAPTGGGGRRRPKRPTLGPSATPTPADAGSTTSPPKTPASTPPFGSAGDELARLSASVDRQAARAMPRSPTSAS